MDATILGAVGRASKRSSRLVHEELKQGLYGLATIACIAPWAGLFGTILGIVGSFGGITGPKREIYPAISGRLSESMLPTAFGLVVGIVALCCYRYLEDRLQTLDREMEGAIQELMNRLSRFRGRPPVRLAINRIGDSPMFGEKSLAELSRDETFERRCMFLAASALAMAWFAQMLRYFGHDSLPFYSSVLSACVWIPLMFAISCLAVSPVWTKLLGRRSGGLMALGSAFCLCWSLAELALGVSLP